MQKYGHFWVTIILVSKFACCDVSNCLFAKIISCHMYMKSTLQFIIFFILMTCYNVCFIFCIYLSIFLLITLITTILIKQMFNKGLLYFSTL